MIYLVEGDESFFNAYQMAKDGSMELVGFLYPEDVIPSSEVMVSDNPDYPLMCEEEYFVDCYTSYESEDDMEDI